MLFSILLFSSRSLEIYFDGETDPFNLDGTSTLTTFSGDNNVLTLNLCVIERGLSDMRMFFASVGARIYFYFFVSVFQLTFFLFLFFFF